MNLGLVMLQEWMWTARHKDRSSDCQTMSQLNVKRRCSQGFQAFMAAHLLACGVQVGIMGLLVIYAQAAALSCSRHALLPDVLPVQNRELE